MLKMSCRNHGQNRRKGKGYHEKSAKVEKEPNFFQKIRFRNLEMRKSSPDKHRSHEKPQIHKLTWEVGT